MKTVIIFDQCGESPISFYLLEGDYQRLNGIYVNHYRHDPKLAEELCDLFYDKEGESLLTPEDSFPTQAVKDGAIVIVAGFIP